MRGFGASASPINAVGEVSDKSGKLMEFRTFDIEGPIEIVPKKYVDERGYFSELFRADLFCGHAGPVEFVQENQSLSVRAGTIRGIHFQSRPAAQGKLVRCMAGCVFDVAIDLRQGSQTYSQWTAIILSSESNNQLWIPVGFGHAFCTLKPNSVISYRVTDYYSPDNDKGVLWNDRKIAVDWPSLADPATLSAKDRVQPSLAELPEFFSLKG
jgi:dTDP-4-dehydrorhamnose 3,5-epimerase